MQPSRRNFLRFAGIVPLTLLLAGRAGAESSACYDPKALSLSQRNLRRSVEYVEVSTDEKLHCGACAFFVATQDGCGTCQLLSGPVNAGAFCNSFAQIPS